MSGTLESLSSNDCQKRILRAEGRLLYLGIDKYIPTIPTESELLHLRAATNNCQRYMYRLLLRVHNRLYEIVL